MHPTRARTRWLHGLCILLLLGERSACRATASGGRGLLQAELLQYLSGSKKMGDGAVIALPKGQVGLESTLTIRASNVTIIGSDEGSEILCPKSSSALIIGAPGLTLRNLTFKDCRARSAIQLRNVQRFQTVNATFDRLKFIGNNIENDFEHGGAAVSIGEGCSLEVKHSIFKDNRAQFGGALYVSLRGSLLVEDSLFKNNTASFLGGGAIFSSGSIKVANTKFQNCKSDGAYDDPAASGPLGRPLEPFRWFDFPEPGASGGAIRIHDGPVSAISKSYFGENVAAAGGAISATYSSHSPSEMLEELLHVTAKTLGQQGLLGFGACANVDDVSQQKFKVSDCYFGSNRATSDSDWVKDSIYQGGAIHLSVFRPDLNLRIIGSDFEENSAWSGGAMHIVTPHSTSVAISNCNFNNNRARATGGAVTLRNIGSTEWTANSVTGNMAGLGGGIFLTNNAHFSGIGQSRAVNGTPVAGQPLIFENNTAFDGGAIACVYCGSTVIQDPILKGNLAARNGGGVLLENGLSEFFLQQLVAERNQALKGGGMYVNSVPSLRISAANFPAHKISSIFERNRAVSGGGLYLSAEHRRENIIGISRTKFQENLAGKVEKDEPRLEELYRLAQKSLPTSTDKRTSDSCGNGGGGGMCLALGDLPRSSSAQITMDDLSFSRNKATVGGGLLLSLSGDWDKGACQDEPSFLSRPCNTVKLVKSKFTDNTASKRDPALSVNRPDLLSVSCALNEEGSSLQSVLVADPDDCLVLNGNKIVE